MLLVAGWPSWQAAVSLVGGALATAGLIGVWFQYIGNAQAAEENQRQLRQAVRDEAPAIRDSVVDAMAFTPEKLLDVTAPEVLDRVVENSLAKQLGDRAFAADIYRDLKAQTLRSPERWYDLRISASLTPWTKTADQMPAMYVATFRYDYHVRNQPRELRFACVSDPGEYRELQEDPSITEVWFFQAKPGLDATSRDVFELAEVTVAGAPQKVRRSTRAGAQYYSVRLGSELDLSGDVAVSFMYRALVQQHSHTVNVDLIKPTHNVSIELNYGGAGIRYVSAHDYIASSMRPSISKTLPTDPSPSVALTFDGWVLPKAGVAFVWVLDEELRERQRR